MLLVSLINIKELWTDLSLQSGHLLLHILLALLLFLQQFLQAVLLIFYLPQPGGEGELLTCLLLKQPLEISKKMISHL